MDFSLPPYISPDFSQPCFTDCPNVSTAPAPADGIAPVNYHCTSIFPEYYKIDGEWRMAEHSRGMNCVTILRDPQNPEMIDFRQIKAGDPIVIGRNERGIDGIFVHSHCFEERYHNEDRFAFRVGRSRETAFSQDYDTLYNLLMHESQYGKILWVLGPACVFDSDARTSMSWLIENGFAHGILGGNALATHDLEAGLFGTALGQDIYSQQPQPYGHYNHLDIINRVTGCGSIQAFVEEFQINTGIIHACIEKQVPYVFSGSIRDDGPLPGVITDSRLAQDAMRKMIDDATTVICMATQLHTIAAANLTPCYRVVNGMVRPLYIYTVDVTEYAIHKLSDRGSMTATGIVTNAQDFLTLITKSLRKKLES